jgi:PKD repeat protein
MGFGRDMAYRSLRLGVILAVVVAVVLVGSVTPSERTTASGPGPSAVSGVLVSPTVALSASSTRAGTEVEVAPAFSTPSDVVALGPEPPTDPVTVEVGLALPDPSAFAGLVSALYSPGTPEYKSFLAPSELAQRFGPSPSTVSAAQTYFERFDLTARASPDHLLLTVTGPSARVGAAFGTTFEEYRETGGGWFFSHPTPATLPALAPWSGAYGLGNATPFVPSTTAPTLARAGTTPDATCIGLGAGLDPCEVWQAYNMTSLISGGTNGSGIRLAVVDAYSSDENQTLLASDLDTFAVSNGIAPGAVNYVYPDPPPGNLNLSSNLAWNVEDALDLEWARAAAPGATIDMTLSPDAGVGLYEAVDWLVAHQAANVISMSWGEPDVGVFNAAETPCAVACNASTDGSYGLLAPVLEFAAAEGISVFAASGDCGASDGTSGLSTNFPASDPDVTGVGGTDLTVGPTGDWLGEVAWSGNSSGARGPGCQNQGGSGGGYSPFPRPGWQEGLPSRPATRGVPDVALDAANPVGLILHGQEWDSAGTSVSTPVWAGIAAIADQYAGGPLGLLDPSLYAIAAGPNDSTDLHDITSGSNGYPAAAGWDPVTGLGSPQVAALVVDLAHRFPVTSSNLGSFVYATPRFGRAPATVTFHVNATGGAGTYPLEGVSFGDGNASFAPGGAAKYTYEDPGVYSAQAYVADSTGNYSVSPPLAIVVGGGNALSVTLTSSTDVPVRGESVLFSAAATGGVAPYKYNFSFGEGTFLDGSPLSATNHVFGANGSYCAAVVVSDSASPMDGGASARVAIGVGSAPLPDCRNDTLPLTMTPTPNLGVRDAPADFADLFSVSGGSTAASTLPPSLQFSSSDPYLAACGCAIFRTPGVYPVNGYANDSENEQTTSTTNVTVAPALVGTFTANQTVGVAPLTVGFHASATGGYEANATTTVWTFGDGVGAVGASVSTTYSAPGLYVAVGHLSDLGDGNASEAFLIDVEPAGASSLPFPPFLVATVTPAVDVSLGTTVNLTARLVSPDGSVVPSAVRWSLGSDSGGYRALLNWTYSSPSSLAANGSLTVTVSATDLATDQAVHATLELPGFAAVEPGAFLPRVDALEFTDSGGPASGSAPLSWTGTAAVTGPGTVSVLWVFGDGNEDLDLTTQHSFGSGLYTVVVTATDSWGDSATDVLPVGVSGGLGLTASLSATAGAAPLTVTCVSTVTGGLGPPYQFRWSFGEGAVATAENTTHTFGSSGRYNVTLNVTDPGGDSAMMNWTVTVTPGATGFPSVVFLVVGAVVGAGAALAAVVSRRRSPGGAATL